MKRFPTFPIFLSTASLLLLVPPISAAPGTGDTASLSQSRAQAMQMVPAQATLVNDLNGTKVKDGTRFQATLDDNVLLKGGTELPRGTKLIGTVATDTSGNPNATLALRFTQTQLKDGKVIPIEATIMGLGQAPIYAGMPSYNQSTLSQWNGKTLDVDVIGAVSGVDLHSRIADSNSAVFQATKKDDVKVPAGTEMALAIALRG